jgi:AraC-like DNA-binding protein
VRFDHFIPRGALKPFISTLAIQETEDVSEYSVLPDTGVVVGFQFKGRLSIVKEKDKTPLSTFGVSGITDRFKVFSNSKNIGTVLVFFKEGGAAHFFKTPIHELFRESVSLDNFLLRSELLVTEEQLCEAKTDAKRIEVIENFLLTQLRSVEPDKLVSTALALIHKSKGNIRISQLTKDLNISQSPLEKRFRSVVGTSPKKFAAIIRMKHALKSFQQNQSLTDLGYEAGFYDQAHFIKEFRTFTGQSPTSFFSSPKT